MITTRADFHKIIDLSKPGAEVGAASGVFSLEILQWGIAKLYLVDIWETKSNIPGMASWEQHRHDDNYNQAVERLKGYPNAEFMKGLSYIVSKRIPDESLGFVYVDACHEYEYVMQDLKAWVPKLVKGGVCACHDFKNTDYGVEKAVRNFTHRKYQVHELIEDGAIENIGCYFIKE
jgi:hypothetical protein